MVLFAKCKQNTSFSWGRAAEKSVQVPSVLMKTVGAAYNEHGLSSPLQDHLLICHNTTVCLAEAPGTHGNRETVKNLQFI